MISEPDMRFADPEYRFAFALTKNRLAFTPEQSTMNRVASAVRAALSIPEP
jgi:hypothetical protein